MKLTLNSNNLLYPVLIISPWVNILIRHGFLIEVIAVFLIFIFLLILKNPSGKRTNTDVIGLSCILLLIFSAMCSLLYHLSIFGLTYENGNYLNFFHFYTGLTLLLGFWFIALSFGINIHNKIYWFAYYFFIVSIINIFWGGIVDVMGLPRSWELMQHENYFDGSGRPFGLTGNASVNSTMLAICYLIMVRSKYVQSIRMKSFWFLLLFAGVVIQKSGSGMASLLIVIFYHMTYVRLIIKLKIFIALLIMLYLGFFYSLTAFYKISFHYVMHIYSWLEKNFITFWNFEFTILDLLFGKAVALGETSLTTDFGALFIFNQMGIIYFSFMTLLLLRIAFRSKLMVDKFIIFIVFLTGFHYQVIFFLSSSIIFSMYMVAILSERKNNQPNNNINYFNKIG